MRYMLHNLIKISKINQYVVHGVDRKRTAKQAAYKSKRQKLQEDSDYEEQINTGQQNKINTNGQIDTFYFLNQPFMGIYTNTDTTMFKPIDESEFKIFEEPSEFIPIDEQNKSTIPKIQEDSYHEEQINTYEPLEYKVGKNIYNETLKKYCDDDFMNNLNCTQKRQWHYIYKDKEKFKDYINQVEDKKPIDEMMKTINFDQLAEQIQTVSAKPEYGTIEKQIKKYYPHYVEQDEMKKYPIEIQLEEIYKYIHNQLEHIEDICQNNLQSDDISASLTQHLYKYNTLLEDILHNVTQPNNGELFFNLKLDKLAVHIRTFIEYCVRHNNIKYSIFDYLTLISSTKAQIKTKQNSLEKKYRKTAKIQSELKLFKKAKLIYMFKNTQKILLTLSMLITSFKPNFSTFINEEDMSRIFYFLRGCDRNDLIDQETLKIIILCKQNNLEKCLTYLSVKIAKLSKRLTDNKCDLEQVKKEIKALRDKLGAFVDFFLTMNSYKEFITMIQEIDQESNSATEPLLKDLLVFTRMTRYASKFQGSSWKNRDKRLRRMSSLKECKPILSDYKQILEFIDKRINQFITLNRKNVNITPLFNQIPQHEFFKDYMNIIEY